MESGNNNMQNALKTLRKHWGYDAFRPGQSEIISSVLEGRDTLAMLPTGGGKSICFQVPGMMSGGITIVVTPLIALMKDQVQNLKSRGIKALCVHSAMDWKEVELTLNNAVNGDFKFLYISPERLATGTFLSYLALMDVSLLVVDEAHCICQWGYDFRPSYMGIAKVREFFPDIPVLALTATATPTVCQDIMLNLGFREPNLLKSSFARPNLSYIVREREDKIGETMKILSGVKGTAIIYMRSRTGCEKLSAILCENGFKATFYHAGLSPFTRNDRQEKWKRGEFPVMVCTNAFGMGIDKADVRAVIHFDLPDAPEAYFQEAGRAGRDGKESYAVLLYNQSDITRLKSLATKGYPSLEYIEKIYHLVLSHHEIPYDTGEGHSFRFDLGEFGAVHHLSYGDLKTAIEYICKTGHWSYEESRDVPTRVRICASRSDLYEINFQERSQADVMEALMRKYPGIFYNVMTVDEDMICSMTSLTQAELHRTLYNLSLNHYINYIPAAQSGIITLNYNRLEPKNVNLDPAKYAFLKAAFIERSTKMISYVSYEGECRTAYLLEYFGEKDAKPCGKCDICRSNRKK